MTKHEAIRAAVERLQALAPRATNVNGVALVDGRVYVDMTDHGETIQPHAEFNEEVIDRFVAAVTRGWRFEPAEATAPRQPMTEWPGPGEEPPGLWVFERKGVVGKLRGRFVLVPDSRCPVWVCSSYWLKADDAEDGDRFIPVDD